MEFLGGPAPGNSLERVHAKGHVHAWAVGQEGSQSRLLKQAEDQDLIPGSTGETRLDLAHAPHELPNPTDSQTQLESKWSKTSPQRCSHREKGAEDGIQAEKQMRREPQRQ